MSATSVSTPSGLTNPTSAVTPPRGSMSSQQRGRGSPRDSMGSSPRDSIGSRSGPLDLPDSPDNSRPNSREFATTPLGRTPVPAPSGGLGTDVRSFGTGSFTTPNFSGNTHVTTLTSTVVDENSLGLRAMAGVPGELDSARKGRTDEMPAGFGKLYADHLSIKQGMVRENNFLFHHGAKWPEVHRDFGDSEFRRQKRLPSGTTAPSPIRGMSLEDFDFYGGPFPGLYQDNEESNEEYTPGQDVSTFVFDDGRVRPISDKSPFGQRPKSRSVTPWNAHSLGLVVDAQLEHGDSLAKLEEEELVPRFDTRECFYCHACGSLDPVMIDYCFVALGQVLSKRRLPIGAGPWADSNSQWPMFVAWTKHYSDADRVAFKSRLLCVAGNLVPQPLRDVRELVAKSVKEDRHGVPLRMRDMSQLECTVLVVTSFESALDWTDWQIGMHGIIISFEDYRGNIFSDSYLPDVPAMSGWDKEQTINCLIRKAGYNGYLDATFRKQQVTLTRFTTARVSKTYAQHQEDTARSVFDFVSFEVDEVSLATKETISAVEATLDSDSVMTELSTPRTESEEEEETEATRQWGKLGRSTTVGSSVKAFKRGGGSRRGSGWLGRRGSRRVSTAPAPQAGAEEAGLGPPMSPMRRGFSFRSGPKLTSPSLAATKLSLKEIRRGSVSVRPSATSTEGDNSTHSEYESATSAKRDAAMIAFAFQKRTDPDGEGEGAGEGTRPGAGKGEEECEAEGADAPYPPASPGTPGTPSSFTSPEQQRGSGGSRVCTPTSPRPRSSASSRGTPRSPKPRDSSSSGSGRSPKAAKRRKSVSSKFVEMLL